jgi:hypothetical protein
MSFSQMNLFTFSSNMVLSHHPPKVKPTLVLVSRMGWGDIQNQEQHVGLDYKD